mmetsp:Transcript_24374/g.37578  ORF Transcript_24374/g.37578 Transcript_24374/m.37578 type:complete len:1959 (-) Transcript_24374:259-6135(-)
MAFWRTCRALFWRNAIYRKRRPVGTLLEFGVPVIFFLLLLWLKISVQDTDGFKPEVKPAEIRNYTHVIRPLTFSDWLVGLKVQRVCVRFFSEEFVEDNEENIDYNLKSDGWLITGNQYGNANPLIRCDPTRCDTPRQDATPLCEVRQIGLVNAPANFSNYLNGRYGAELLNEDVVFRTFDSEDDMTDYVTGSSYEESVKLAMGIVFDSDFGVNNQYHYTLRQNGTNFNNPEEAARPVSQTTPRTDIYTQNFYLDDDQCDFQEGGGTPDLGNYGLSCTGQYVYNGVLTVQRLVQDYILHDGNVGDEYEVAEGGVGYVPFPTREYEQDGFYAAISDFIPLIFVLALLYPVSATIRTLVTEKEQRHVELLKIMSVTQFQLEFTWIISLLIFYLPAAICLALVGNDFWKSTDSGTLAFYMICVYISNIFFCTTVSAFFTKATKGVLVGLLFYFVGYILLAAAGDFKETATGQLGGMAFHPVTAFSICLQIIGDYEDQGTGINSETASVEYPNGLTYNMVLGWLIRDIILMALFTWYFNRVVKGEYGRANPMHFPFTRSYWCPGSAKDTNANGEGESNESSTEASGVHIEPVADALKAQEKDNKCVSIKNLRMCFTNVNGTEKVAVEGLNLNMYTGQVTALLGHNGAGKSTTINMLTGLLKPTSGDAAVVGTSIVHQMPIVRQKIGICLQHDCLFDLLNVQEHIEFFAMLKGSYSKENVEKTMKDVALYEKRFTPSKNLSGGMKRKLSVAIAFCGDSKVVFLDEPTSGMDPFSRRFTWNVIRKYRQDRCIVLTTHFMDEADLLGDRIAILAEGQLRCVGSSIFLKKTYGVGYQLTLEKAPFRDGEGKMVMSEDERTSKEGNVISMIENHVEEASVLSNVGTELSFQLPLKASSHFPSMLRELEEVISKGDVVIDYGVSITTLEEVFLIIARGEDTNRLSMRQSGISIPRLSGMSVSPPAIEEEEKQAEGEIEVPLNDVDGGNGKVEKAKISVGSSLKLGDLVYEPTFGKHIVALMKKRALNFRRDKKAWFCSTILPAFITLMGFISVKFAPDIRRLDKLEIRYDELNSNGENPVVFNEAGSVFECEPGTCVNKKSWNLTRLTGEEYSFCGIDEVLSNCTIDMSDDIMENADDAEPLMPGAFTTILESSQYLSDTWKNFKESRYGAVYFTREYGSLDSNSTLFQPSAQCSDPTLGDYRNANNECSTLDGLGYVVAYNFTGIHSSVMYTALADEAIFREAKGSNEPEIVVSIHPLPITKFEKEYAAGEDAFFSWFTLVFSFPFITGTFATFVVTERRSKAKHLQTVAGVKPSAYWLSSYLWDVMNYQLPLWIIILLVFIVDIEVFATSQRDVISGVIVLLFLFGPAAAGFTYCETFFFKDPTRCQFFVIITNLLIGFGGPLASFILRIIDAGDANTSKYLDAAETMEWVLRITPAFCAGHGLFNVININFFEQTQNNRQELSVWSGEILLYDVIFLLWESVVYLCLAIMLDHLTSNPAAWQKVNDIWNRVTCRGSQSSEAQIHLSNVDELDQDVRAEHERVMSGTADSEAIVLKSLSKRWNKSKLAVDNMTLAIPAGECFGLLGVNGAGKTTTMGMLTAEFPPSGGDAWLNGYSVTHQPDMIRRSIGYCPQFDAHFTNMTGREHVELYASIKGIPAEQLNSICAAKCKEVGLNEDDMDKISAGYSGGMKRKLSVACASIGQPRIVFLDEPSTGMDPVARRDMWSVVLNMVRGGETSVVLTTHSMEECEALCPRIGIMATGQLKCLGSAQRLKSRFGMGYQVELSVKGNALDDEDYVLNIAKIIKSTSGVETDAESFDVSQAETAFVKLDAAKAALDDISGDDSLSSLLSETNPGGNIIFQEASSNAGVSVIALASFATMERRVKEMISFVESSYENTILRERQENKCRFEIASAGVKVSGIFEKIEDNKDRLKLADYGVSQTSLEQVFNIHAAVAEEEKQGKVER